MQEHGLASSVSFWPGSSAPINGKLPTHLIKYQDGYESRKHIDNVLKWIDYPPGTRPSFIATYFPITDIIGHAYGPDSKEVIYFHQC